VLDEAVVGWYTRPRLDGIDPKMNGGRAPEPLNHEDMQPRNSGSFETEPVRQANRLARKIRAAECGDEKAVRSLLAVVAPVVSRVVGLVLGRRHPDAEDLVQESLVDFLRALPVTGDELELGQLAAFVSLRRALEAWKWSPAAYEVLAPDEDDSSVRWYWRFSPEHVAREEQRRTLSRLLTTLPDDEAEVLGLRVLAGLGVEQIAEFMGFPASAVRGRLRTAKRQLLEELEGDLRPGNELHPEALRDLERVGALSAADRERLIHHELECPACALERDVAADFTRRWPRLPSAGVRLGRAIDSATAQWVWNVSRRVSLPKRNRRLTWAALAALVTVLGLAAGALWLRYQSTDAQPLDAGDDATERGADL
jgi:RNA polymerase sigma-70 factor (ECF subfamily)